MILKSFCILKGCCKLRTFMGSRCHLNGVVIITYQNPGKKTQADWELALNTRLLVYGKQVYGTPQKFPNISMVQGP